VRQTSYHYNHHIATHGNAISPADSNADIKVQKVYAKYIVNRCLYTLSLLLAHLIWGCILHSLQFWCSGMNPECGPCCRIEKRNKTSRHVILQHTGDNSIHIHLTFTKGNGSGWGQPFLYWPKGGQTLRLHPLSQHHTLASTLASVKSLGNGLF